MIKTRVIGCLMNKIVLATIGGSSGWTQPQLLTGWWTSEPQSSGNSTNKVAIERNWRWRASLSLSLTDTWPGPWGSFREGESVFTIVWPSICVAPAALALRSQNGSLNQTVKAYTSACWCLLWTPPQIYGNADTILEIARQKIFSQADWLKTK